MGFLNFISKHKLQLGPMLTNCLPLIRQQEEQESQVEVESGWLVKDFLKTDCHIDPGVLDQAGEKYLQSEND